MTEEILEFWFVETPSLAPPPHRLLFWFNGGDEADHLIRERFAATVERAARGEFDSWCETPRGALALILVLDQFPRNIYRSSPLAYTHDAKALACCIAGLESGHNTSLGVMEKAFFYLPLEHSEDLRMQERSVALFSALLDEAPPAFQGVCGSFYDYALRHRDVIARFGRFPHRNRILGRESTAEEEEFLKQPGSSF
jgi:uncharacterized protein (DUF924 family)